MNYFKKVWEYFLPNKEKKELNYYLSDGTIDIKGENNRTFSVYIDKWNINTLISIIAPKPIYTEDSFEEQEKRMGIREE